MVWGGVIVIPVTTETDLEVELEVCFDLVNMIVTGIACVSLGDITRRYYLRSRPEFLMSPQLLSGDTTLPGSLY